jgi:carbon storage regulator CsrA
MTSSTPTALLPCDVEMLVLSRKKKNESIRIDGGVEIRVIALDGNRVKLGIEAPASVHIVRTELLPSASHVSVTRIADTDELGECHETANRTGGLLSFD